MICVRVRVEPTHDLEPSIPGKAEDLVGCSFGVHWRKNSEKCSRLKIDDTVVKSKICL